MIRMRLDRVDGVVELAFDIAQRRLEVVHSGAPGPVAEALAGLDLGARQVAHDEGVAVRGEPDESRNRGPLRWALAINLTLFALELAVGLIAGSMGVVADALDMLADALVYALSLVAVGSSAARKRSLAAASGVLQGALATLGLVEVLRRFLMPSDAPDVSSMIAISLLALVANFATLMLLRRTQRGEAHIEASWIFTSNDIKANALVIVAGLLVLWSGSRIPDLLVGGLIFGIVANGARRILALSRTPETAPPA